MPYVIQRGYHGRPQYWSGFKEQYRRRPGLTWSYSEANALRFERETDADQIVVGLRMRKRHAARAVPIPVPAPE